MSCRKQDLTERNGVAENRLLWAPRLDYIAATWEYRRIIKCNEWVAKHNDRIEEMNHFAENQHEFDQKYWIPWVEQVCALSSELDALVLKWEGGEHVIPADWDAITAGKERKSIVIVAANVPKDCWPLPVRERFPNLIELLMHELEGVRQEDHEEQYAAAIGSIADGTSSIVKSKKLQADYKKQYHEIVKHFAQQDMESITLECSAGGSSDAIGQQTPIEQLREQLNIGQSIFEKDVDEALLIQLRPKNVTSQDFRAGAWNRTVLNEQGWSMIDEAVQGATRKVQECSEIWQSYPGSDADSHDAFFVASPGQGLLQPGNSTTSDDRVNMHEEHEPSLDTNASHVADVDFEDELRLHREHAFDRIEIPLGNDIQCEDDLMLVEPNLDHFGLDLDNFVNYDGEFFLPFDI